MIDKDSEVAFNRFLELEINKRIKNHKFKQPSKLKNINILKEFKMAFIPLCTIFKFYHINGDKSLPRKLVENSINDIKKTTFKKTY